MSKIIATAAIRGAHRIVGECDALLARTIAEKGKEAAVEFPETAYFLPMIYALLGEEVKQVGDMPPILDYAKGLLHEVPSDSVWLPYLGPTLDAGVATLFAEEMIMALRYLHGTEPQKDCNGFFTDTIMRTLGIQLVDGRMPGFAACVGALPTNEQAVALARAHSPLAAAARAQAEGAERAAKAAGRLAAERLEVRLGETPLEERPRVDARRGVALEKDLVGRLPARQREKAMRSLMHEK